MNKFKFEYFNFIPKQPYLKYNRIPKELLLLKIKNHKFNKRA